MENPFIKYEIRIRIRANDYRLVPLIFKNIKFGRYFISNYGEIYDVEKNDWINGWIQKDGYPRYSLVTENGDRKKYYAHVLVANTFLVNPNPEIYTVVNHKDGNKLHCHPSNLEFCTPYQNVQHAVDNGFYSGPIFDPYIIEEICVRLKLGWGVHDICIFFSMWTTYTYPQVKSLVDSMLKGVRYVDICKPYRINNNF